MTLEFEGNVAVLKFNHPEVMNAIGSQMLADFQEALVELRNPKHGARCLLLTGEGRGFCAGANLQDMGERRQKGGTAGDGLRAGHHPVLLGLRDLPMPMISAVNGAAAGVGMSYAVIADLVCASKQAFFLQAFARIGLVPDGGSTFMLPRLVGWGRAIELSMLAERLPAEKAYEWGLVNRLYDDNEALMEGAMELAQRLANGPKSLALVRQAYWNTWHSAFEQQLDLEARLQAQAGATKDHLEGRTAFLEKRDPQFTGD